MSANPEGLKKSSLFILIIVTLAIGLYLNTLKNGFVYDDEYTIVNNTLIKSFDNLPFLFDKTAYFNLSKEMSYRPVVTFTYFIDYALYGLKPWGYHLTNILLHAINGVLLYIFLTLLLTLGAVPILRSGTGFQPVMTGKMPVPPNRDSFFSPSSRFMSLPFLISILFVSHPVLTEAVNCISYREDLLAFLFYMVTLILYLLLRTKLSTEHSSLTTVSFYLLSCFTYFFALLSKEMAVTLPLIVICYEWLYGNEKIKLVSRLFNRYVIGYITITIFYVYLHLYFFHNPNEQIPAWILPERFLTLPRLIMNYLSLSLFPNNLSADYVIDPLNSPFSPMFIFSIIVLFVIFSITLKMGNRKKSILFGALFFLVTLIPVYNLVSIVNPFAERYLYLPLVGFIMSTVCISHLITEKLKIKPEYLNHYISVFLLIVLIIFSFSVVDRNTAWKDNYLLWSNTVAKMPNSSRAHNGLGFVHYNNGQIDEAIRAYLTAIKLKFGNTEAHNNLGLAYLRQGNYNKAIYELKTALRLKPNHAGAYYNLGIVYIRQNLFDQAIKELLTAIRLKPDYINAYYNIGLVYFEQGRYDEAINAFTMLLRWDPNDKEAYRNLEALMKKKKGY